MNVSNNKYLLILIALLESPVSWDQELMSRRRRRRSMKLEFHVNPNYVTEFEINLIRHVQVM